MNRITQLRYSSHFLFRSPKAYARLLQNILCANILPAEAVRAPGFLHSQSQRATRAIALRGSHMAKSEHVSEK